MVAVYPDVHAFKVKNPVKLRPGKAGKVALVGAFDSEITNPQVFAGLDEAYEVLGENKTNFKGVSCLEWIFKGASSIIAVNITTWTGSGAEKTADTTLTTAKLSDALTKIKSEDFDILYVADSLEDNAFPILTDFLDDKFEKKYPAGYVAGITRANSSGYLTSLALAGDQSYGIICGQTLTVDGVALDIVETGAYYCGLLAGMNVGNSMTKKIVPYVTAVSPELSFDTGGEGLALMGAGGTTFECQDRTAGRFVVVNSEQPNGLDLYINRSRDYVVKELALHQFLGDRNRPRTLSEIKQELDRVKDRCVNTLDLLEDIEYNIVKKDDGCVDVNITKLLFARVIVTINVYITLEVE